MPRFGSVETFVCKVNVDNVGSIPARGAFSATEVAKLFGDSLHCKCGAPMAAANGWRGCSAGCKC